jgi:creatinine amidohydrolase
VGRPIRLRELPPADAARILGRTPRLIIPVGTLTPRGPHLPLGCDTILLEHLTDDVSAATGIARAPAIPYGAHAASEDTSPGGASLTRKSLHRMMNELIESWEIGAKVSDITILTAHATEGHQEALSTIRTNGTVRLIDVFGFDFSGELRSTAGQYHGGLIDTSLLLAIAPEQVLLERIPPGIAADADLGHRLYRRMRLRVLARLGHRESSPVEPDPTQVRPAAGT